MTIYVDDWRQHARLGPVEASWSHLLGDDPEELHRFAGRLGLRRAWYQEHRRHRALNHYDVTEETRRRAIDLGAVPITWREAGRLVRRWRREDRSSPDRSAPVAETVGHGDDPPDDHERGHRGAGDDGDPGPVDNLAHDQGDRR